MAWRSRLEYMWVRACRQKLVGQADTHTNLHRCLNTLQLTAIGLGSTVGVGIYVLLGVAIRDYAGPSVIVSFLLSGLVVLSNALIYAEFGSFIPHTGSSYTYMYRATGELAAFLVGWSTTISALCSAATGARAWSGFLDALFNNSIQNFFDSKLGHVDIGPPFSRSLDWTALTFSLLVTLVVSFNVHCSSMVNTVLAVLTTGVLVFVTFTGPILGDISWAVGGGEGGFLPYGVGGIVTGASAAFFAFNGYDSICVAAEEAKDPRRGVPRAILTELLIVVVVYCGAAFGTLCLVPYSVIDLRAPIPSAYEYRGVTWAKYLVTIGPIIAITNLNILALYAVSRIIYRMAKDGLVAKQFAYLHPRTKVPLFGVVLCGVSIGVISLLLDLKDLVRFTVLCMLFQYIILAPALVAMRAADKESQDIAMTELGGRGKEASQGEGGNERGAETEDEEELLNLGFAEITVTVSNNNDSAQGGLVGDGGDTEHSLLLNGSLPHDGQESARVEEGGGGGGEGGEDISASGVASDGTASGIAEPAQYEPVDGASENLLASIDASGDKDAAQDRTTDLADQTSTWKEVSETEDNTTQQELGNGLSSGAGEGEFAAEESTLQDPLLENSGGSETLAPLNLRKNGNKGAGWHLPWGGEYPGCFEATRREFFGLLSTRLCLVLLMVLLAGLAMQIGAGWGDLRKGRGLSVVSTVLILSLVLFLCEVLRARCGPGHHDGFKVRFVPYLPMLSSFLNMLLLVSAADSQGIIEFIVLILIGFIIYVITVLVQFRNINDDVTPDVGAGEESRGLLSPGGEDEADSDGSL